jgi:hypothetical protein
MEKTYSKFGEMKTMLMDDVKLLSEIVALCDGQKKFEELIGKKNNIKDLVTVFKYNLNNPKDKKYNHKIASCLLELPISSNHHPVNADLCYIRRNLPKNAADHVLDILYMNNVTHTFCDNKGSSHNDSASIPLFANLINHSCLPNAFPVFVDNKIVICISEPIKAGDQIFCSYM